MLKLRREARDLVVGAPEQIEGRAQLDDADVEQRIGRAVRRVARGEHQARARPGRGHARAQPGVALVFLAGEIGAQLRVESARAEAARPAAAG